MSRNVPSSKVRELAQRLLAEEVARNRETEPVFPPLALAEIHSGLLASVPTFGSLLTDDISAFVTWRSRVQLRKVLMVVKMQRTDHSRDIRQYEITSQGVVVGERLRGYDHLITGIPRNDWGRVTRS